MYWDTRGDMLSRLHFERLRQLLLPQFLVIVTSIISGLGSLGGVAYAERPSSSQGHIQPLTPDASASSASTPGAPILSPHPEADSSNDSPNTEVRPTSITWDTEHNRAYWDQYARESLPQAESAPRRDAPMFGYTRVHQQAAEIERKGKKSSEDMKKLVDIGQRAFNTSKNYVQRIPWYMEEEGGLKPLVKYYRQAAAHIAQKDLEMVGKELAEGKPADDWRKHLTTGFELDWDRADEDTPVNETIHGSQDGTNGEGHSAPILERLSSLERQLEALGYSAAIEKIKTPEDDKRIQTDGHAQHHHEQHSRDRLRT
mmetsp:Transcript_150633/g.280812  ORF Transcript_150633/g.280812 Transcript_150633/m.280812 type:complete len:314 (-) Transcript_150633:59-1000(-)